MSIKSKQAKKTLRNIMLHQILKAQLSQQSLFKELIMKK